jgi:sugar porter (SP) family MFS transporter
MNIIIRHFLAHARVFAISFMASLGGYLFGFHFGVITAMLPFLRTAFALNQLQEGFLTGSLALGCILGCLWSGKISDEKGRKPTLGITAVFFTVSALGMAMAPNLLVLLAFRFSAGIGVGMASIICPLYLAEISPAAIRGRMVAIYQLMIVLGIFGTNLSNYMLATQGEDAWRWMVGLGVLPALLLLVGFNRIPESPRWLLLNLKTAEADKVLHFIGDKNLRREAHEAGMELHSERASIREIFSPSLCPVVMRGIMLAVFQQFCGINIVFNYTSTIFASVGANLDRQLLETVLISLVNIVFTLVAMWQVDRLGRKPLMLIGALGLAIDYVVLSILLHHHAHPNWISLLVIIAIALYASSLAPVTWILIAEIFPNQIRGRASSIAVMSLWLAYFVLVLTFPILSKVIGITGSFYLYAGICLLGLVFIQKQVKETKGKTLEEIEHQQLQ